MTMKTLEECALWYKGMGLWVYPYPSDTQCDYWKYWKPVTQEQYEKMFGGYDWATAVGVKGVVGKKGSRVVRLKWDGTESFDNEMLKDCLCRMGLPDDYPWVMQVHGWLDIMVDTPNVSQRVKGQTNLSLKQGVLVWQGEYVLPSVGVPVYFYKNRLPSERPVQISDDVLMDYVETL